MTALKFFVGGAFLALSTMGSSQIFISEYIEGSSSNKAIEIFNAGSLPVPLSNFKLEFYNNGNNVITDGFFLNTNLVDTNQTQLLSGDVFVIVHPSANASMQLVANAIHTMGFFNGDDAIVLKEINTNTILDVIGIVGVDPGAGWQVGTGATNNNTLVRMDNVCIGETNWNISSTLWDVFPLDTTTKLGTHTPTCYLGPELVFQNGFE